MRKTSPWMLLGALMGLGAVAAPQEGEAVSPEPVVFEAGDAAIVEHLAAVEAWLRAADTAGLRPEQRARRTAALDALRAYRQAGRFPHNHVAPEGRRPGAEVPHGFDGAPSSAPVFIGPHGVRCAVGELIHVSGHEALAREIAGTWNLSFVEEIAHPGLPLWAEAHGFTLEELAAIQPSYSWQERETSEIPPWIAGIGAAEIGAAAALTLNIMDSRSGDYSKGHVRLGYAMGAVSLVGGGVLMWEARTGPHPAPASEGFGDYRYSTQTRYNLYGLGALGAVVGLSSVMASTHAMGELRQRGIALGPTSVSWRW